MFLLPWCHPDCHYLLHCISFTPLWWDDGDHLFPGYCAAWEPPTCSYLPAFGTFFHTRWSMQAFFGQPLTKAFWEGVSIPNFHQASDRCWLPISYYFRSTRVSLC